MLIAALLLLAPLQNQAERPFPLMLGDAAPAIQVAEWVQGKPVTKFEPGQTYVVEFWATWCGPCRKMIPHMNELSKQYAGKVNFVGVSVWEHLDQEAYWVPKFVQDMGDNMTYTVASDRVKPSADNDPGFMAKTWMTAAGQNGIPAAFIVNGEGKIAWIGHPIEIEQPLADVVAGKWDLAAMAKKYALDLRLGDVIAKVRRDVTKAKKEKDFAGAVRVIDGAVAQEPALESTFGLDKYFLLVAAQRTSDAAAYGQRLVAQVFADNFGALNQLAWTIVDPQKTDPGDYALAVKAAERAVELSKNEDADILDTLGLALFKAGKVERAIEVQTRAADLAKGKENEADLRGRLEQFKGAKKNL